MEHQASDANEREYEQKRLEACLKEIEAQITDGLEEVKRTKATVTGTQSYISDEYYSVPKSFAQLVDLAGGMGMLRLAGRMYRFTLLRLKQLERLARSAYFGRVDFVESRPGKGSRPPTRIYIGVSSLMSKVTGEHLILDWRAPVSSIYYDHELGPAKYEAPSGVVSCEVLLKRHFKIRGSEIVLMYDNNLTIFDEILQDTLGKATGDRMRAIVNTIQREQNRIIRDEGRNLLLVQGCAGSGKTSIALHRAAYLLYKHREQMSSRDLLMVTPNRIFEDYTSPVLPELGEEPMRQESFADLGRDLLRGAEPPQADGQEDPPEEQQEAAPEVRVEEFADQLEYLLDSRPTEGYRVRSEAIRLKSSHIFAKALEDYATSIASGDFAFEDLVHNGKVLVSSSEVANLISKDYAYLPLVKRIEKAKRRMEWILDEAETKRFEELRKQVTADAESPQMLEQDIKEAALTRARSEIGPLRERVRSWAPLNYREAYRCLYADDGLLAGLLSKAKGLYGDVPGGADQDLIPSGQALADICRDTVERLDTGLIPYEDLSPILYLKGMLEGLEGSPNTKHVIVDEAQDYNTIQFKVLRLAFPRATFTVLGDLNQTLSPLRSGAVGSEAIAGYENAVVGLGAGKDTQLITLEKSYRSTKEITEFTRAMLDGGQPVEAIERPGERPVIYGVAGKKELAQAIAADIKRLKAEGFESIAVICKTARESWTAHEALKPLLNAKGKKGVHLVTKNQRKFVRGTLIIPSYLAKGLEFEAVIIYDAGERAYPDASVRLVLYTACTRALHRLHLYHTGRPSPIISGIDESLLQRG